MKCGFCSKNLERSWKYCPFCGEQKPGFFRNPFKGFSDKLFTKSFEKMFKQIFDSMDVEELPFKNSKNFVIKMSDLDGVPKIKVYDSTRANIKKSKPAISNRILKNVEEPQASLKEVSGNLFIELQIPDVKSIKDVEVTRLGESVEIRAFAKDKSYFKMVPVPNHSRVLRKELRDGKLFVEMG
jgi:hypothetical protein